MSSIEDQKFVPIIMAGGSGRRLWPKSRSAVPKQFIELVDDSTLLVKLCNVLA